MSLSGLRSSYADADRWLRDHLLVWWSLLALVPGGAYAGAEVLLDGAEPAAAVALGAAFGVPFATLTVLVQRRRRD